MVERAAALSHIRFNKKQNRLEALLQRHLPPHVVYTGDHSFWVRLRTRVKNPDFIVRPFRQTKQVIEVFGDYWHTKDEAVRLIAEYLEVGVKCVVLMEHDIRDAPKVAADRAITMLGCAVT